MSIDDKVFIQERANNLAYVYLTRRDDIEIVQQQTITQGYSEAKRLFEVQLRRSQIIDPNLFWVAPVGVLNMLAESIESSFLPEFRRFHNIEDPQITYYLSRPFYLFLFAMQSEEAFYMCLNESVVTAATATLQPNRESKLSVLDNSALNTIIEQVRAWYEARANLSVAPAR